MTMPKSATASPCACGCGGTTSPGRKFISGHNGRMRTRREPGANGLWCPRCQSYKPVDVFPRKGTYRGGTDRYGYCRPCHSDYQRQQKLERVFNITAVEYDLILEAQGGVCAVCQRAPKKNRLAVDHNHDTGLIRGLVCTACNHGLGYWRDSVARLQAAVVYLTEPPATRALGAERYGSKGPTQATDPKNQYFERANTRRAT